MNSIRDMECFDYRKVEVDNCLFQLYLNDDDENNNELLRFLKNDNNCLFEYCKTSFEGETVNFF